MKHAQPWKAPGYTFSLFEFPPGFEPQPWAPKNAQQWGQGAPPPMLKGSHLRKKHKPAKKPSV